MAIEDIIRALEEEVDGECREILDAAKQQAAGILEDARDEAAKFKPERLGHARSIGEARGQQLVNAARLDNKRTLAAAKERGIADVYQKAESRLSAIRKDGSYPGLFASLAKEAVAGVEGEFKVAVDPADAALAKSVFAEMGSSPEIDTSSAVAGGLTIIADDGHVFRRNTLEGRLAKVRKMGASRVAEILFG